MASLLRVLDDSAQTHEVVLMERHGQQLRLWCPRHIAPGTAVQLKLEGDLLLGESAASVAGSDHFEITMHAQEVLLASWELHPEWRALDSKEYAYEERRNDRPRARISAKPISDSELMVIAVPDGC